jgi:hypothetical protein
MRRFKTIIKPLIGILTVVPFSLIGILVVGTASKMGLKETVSGGEQHYEVNNTAPSPNMMPDGRTVVIERPDPKNSQLSQPGCLNVGKPCETPTGQWVGVWGETVLKRNPS